MREIQVSQYMRRIENAISAFTASNTDDRKEKLIEVFESLRIAMNQDETFIIPVDLPPEVLESFDPKTVQVGDVFEAKEEVRMKMRTVPLVNDGSAMVAFTSEEEVRKGADTSAITVNIDRFLERVLMNPNVEGAVIDPWENDFFLPKNFIKMIFEANLPGKTENTIGFFVQDITKAETTCIVNAAKPSLLGGGGVDGAIHRAAGPELLEECRTLNGCETGQAKLTKGYKLSAEYVIHTVGPIYSGSEADAKLLRNCYWNSLELARKNDIHSITFPAISTGVYGYPLREATEVALKTVSDWLKVNPNHGMSIGLACFDEKTKEVYESIWQENAEKWDQRTIIRENNGMLEQAIQFAMDAHKGSSRKGTNTPYILHPLETLQILSSMNTDTNLMIAGVLHDTLEDTDATLLEIYDRFGVDVAALVNAHTEDKRRCWYMRKLITVSGLQEENVREKMLTLADKVANLRNLYSDYKRIGEELWLRFNAPKHMQAWYYGALNDGLHDLQNYPETADVYWEMTALYKDLFVRYLVDEDKGLLYQIGDSGERFVLKKGKPQWNELQRSVSKNARLVNRKTAERIEENWAEPFWAVHELDLSDAAYETHRTEQQFFWFEMKDGEMMFRGEESGPDDSNGMFMEFAYRLDAENTHRFLVQLRLKHGTRYKLSTVLKKEFVGSEGPAVFMEFCKEHNVHFEPLRLWN